MCTPFKGRIAFGSAPALGASNHVPRRVATTWPDRQRILDMVADDGPWERIEPEAFKARWKHGKLQHERDHSETLQLREHVELAEHTTFGIKQKQAMVCRGAVGGCPACGPGLGRSHAAWSCSCWVEEATCCLHGDVDALVLHIQMHGVEVLSDDGQRVEVAVGRARCGTTLSWMPWTRDGAAWKTCH